MPWPSVHQEQAPKQRCTFSSTTFSSVQFSARLAPPSKRKQQDSTGATAAAAEHHAHTPTSATERVTLLKEAESQLAHQRQHGENPFKLLTVTTDMSTTDWFANVHRTAETKRNQLSLPQQRVNALDRELMTVHVNRT